MAAGYKSWVGGSRRPAPEGLKNEILRDTLKLPAEGGDPLCTPTCLSQVE